MPRRAKDQNGANVDVLLKEEAENIATIKQRLGPQLLETDIAATLDDIYILRFLLSAQTVDDAEKNLRENIAWRVTHLDAIKHIHKTDQPPLDDIIRRFQTVGFAGVSDKGNPIFVVRVAHCDLHGLMNTVTEEQMKMWLHLGSERGFVKIDETTRKTRVLTKMVTIIDLAGFSLTKNNEARFRNALAASSFLNMTHYPQLLGKQVFTNLPRIFYAMYKGFKLIMPKSATEKNGFCPHKNTEKGDASQCLYLQSIGGVNAVPPFLGGKMECPEYLIAMEDRDEYKAMSKVNIRAGSTHVSPGIPVPVANARIKAELLVANHSVLVSANVIPEGKLEADAVDVISKSSAIKVSSSDGLKTFEWDIPVAGELFVTFANDSRFRSKHVEYGFNIVEDSIEESILEGEKNIAVEQAEQKSFEEDDSNVEHVVAEVDKLNIVQEEVSVAQSETVKSAEMSRADGEAVEAADVQVTAA